MADEHGKPVCLVIDVANDVDDNDDDSRSSLIIDENHQIEIEVVDSTESVEEQNVPKGGGSETEKDLVAPSEENGGHGEEGGGSETEVEKDLVAPSEENGGNGEKEEEEGNGEEEEVVVGTSKEGGIEADTDKEKVMDETSKESEKEAEEKVIEERSVENELQTRLQIARNGFNTDWLHWFIFRKDSHLPDWLELQLVDLKMIPLSLSNKIQYFLRHYEQDVSNSKKLSHSI